jgi:alcohol dehydrogenase class IV
MSLPPLRYDYLAPRRIVFGWGRREELGVLAKPLGKRAWLVATPSLANSAVLPELMERLRSQGIEARLLGKSAGEPTIAQVDALAARARAEQVGPGDLVIGVGGGAALDLAKAVAALAPQTANASVREYLEGVGTGRQLVETPLPLIAMPTTAGTGSEATKNAVISVDDPAGKRSLRSDAMMAQVALVDPELTVTSPPHVTAHSGLDAITQLIESYISNRAQPIPQALSLQGLRLALPALPRAWEDPHDRAAREAMSHAALLSGLALANSGLGLAHGVAAALGAICDVPHGLACAVMLVTTLCFNRPVSEDRLAELATAALNRRFSSSAAAADALISAIDGLCEQFGIPRSLGELGVRADQLADIAEGSRGNSLSGNPIPISTAQLQRLLGEML